MLVAGMLLLARPNLRHRACVLPVMDYLNLRLEHISVEKTILLHFSGFQPGHKDKRIYCPADGTSQTGAAKLGTHCTLSFVCLYTRYAQPGWHSLHFQRQHNEVEHYCTAMRELCVHPAHC